MPLMASGDGLGRGGPCGVPRFRLLPALHTPWPSVADPSYGPCLPCGRPGPASCVDPPASISFLQAASQCLGPCPQGS